MQNKPQHHSNQCLCRRDRLDRLQVERNAQLAAAAAEQAAAAAEEDAATPASKRGLLPPKRKELPQVGGVAGVRNKG